MSGHGLTQREVDQRIDLRLPPAPIPELVMGVVDQVNPLAFTLSAFLDGSTTATPGIHYGALASAPVRGSTVAVLRQRSDGFHLVLAVLQASAAASATGAIFSIAGLDTWYKPPGAQWVKVIVIGAGGGGGSGRRGAAGTVRSGGGGGGGGGASDATFAAADLDAAVVVTIGAGGTGGANNIVNDTNGAPGAAGGTTSFGSYLVATGGQGGGAGTASAGPGGNEGVGTFGTGIGIMSFGGNGRGTAAADPGTTGSFTAGGGGGGGLDAANISYNGGNGAVPAPLTGIMTPATGGTVTPTAPGPSALPVAGVLGGGGGGGGCNGAGARIGSNGQRGSGGGGSGGSLDGTGTGAGGNGGDGYCAVIAW